MPDPQLIIPPLHRRQRIGEVLHCAHLISLPQIQLVLRDQQTYQHLRFGEILALRGWLKQETSDFFADEWQNLPCRESTQHLLGFYLQRAGLLDDQQIQSILQEQKRTGFKFGAVAVLNGWVKQQTLDFFLESLFPKQCKADPFVHYDDHQVIPSQLPSGMIGHSEYPSPRVSVPTAEEETVPVSKDDISWIG